MALMHAEGKLMMKKHFMPYISCSLSLLLPCPYCDMPQLLAISALGIIKQHKKRQQLEVVSCLTIVKLDQLLP